MRRNSLFISLVFLFTGFVFTYFILGYQVQIDSTSADKNHSKASHDKTVVSNPFLLKNDDSQTTERLIYLEEEVSFLKQQLREMKLTLQTVVKTAGTDAVISHPEEMLRQRFSSVLNQRLYNLDNLIRGGIDSSLAEDIVRRKNSIELQRLALQDRATRDRYLNTQRYYDELAVINKQDVSLREELGDERYDEFLFSSKQNNRIRIASVMLGSAAEQAGIQKGDIILSYGNSRMFSWQELKDATAEGELGEYVAINIYRDGQIYSFSVPRGPLGTQLGAARLAP